jgi:hypothetical protein
LWFQQHFIEILIVAQLVNKFETLCGKKPNIISSPLFDLLSSQLIVFHNAYLITPQNNIIHVHIHMSSPVTVPSKAWACVRLLAGIAGSNLAGGMDVCLL